MLFNSHLFLLLFLPITLLVFWWLSDQQRAALFWLVTASLLFYAWWRPPYLLLLLVAILGNYGCIKLLKRYPRQRLKLLLFGIGAHLLLLGYYKYSHFFVDTLNQLSPLAIHWPAPLLPLAISFFTFQNIAYLVDCYRGYKAPESLLHYSFFISFFPQLIAGPIVYYREIEPQITTAFTVQARNSAIGLSLLTIGLFKKVVIADNLAAYVDPVFAAANQGETIGFFLAWQAALAYTLQLYFDFCGYSDMATGLARLFGIILPLNFYSPYQASNMIQFWRRWHMTLSRFLRDYVYIPLGGYRRRYLNIMVTLLLGGLWHGAGWHFILWGGLHGLYLIINHLWQAIDIKKCVPINKSVAATLTFLAVVFAWVLFRAEHLSAAGLIYQAMLGLHGFAEPIQYWPWLFIGVLLLIVWFAPNSYQLMAEYQPALWTYSDVVIQKSRLKWQPNRAWAFVMALLAALSLLSLHQGVEAFVYFQF